MSNTINTNQSGPPAGLPPERLAEGYAVKAPNVKKLEPLVPPPRLQDFEMRNEPLFPGVGGLVNPATQPPAGIGSLRKELSTGVDVNLNRAAVAIEASVSGLEDGVTSATAAPRIVQSTEAAEAAALARDQIRYEPRRAMEAQANSSPQSALSVLK